MAEAPPPAEAPAGEASPAPAPVPSAALSSQPAVPGPVPPGAQPVGSVTAGTQEKSGGTTATSGPVNNPLALRHERLQGKISKYVMSSGTGFVNSDLFEGELGFKTESIMLECQSYEFTEGEGVEFDVQADERGRPHAVALKPIVGRKPNDCLGQRHRGYVRRFADRWGFLNAAAFDGDLFVHRDNLLLVPDQLQDGQPPLRTGQAVEFDVALDDRGRTVAKQITTSALLRPCDWIGRRLQGVIRSFQGAWGFVNSDKFAGDLFVHRDALLQQCQDVELAAGTVVEFDVERDHHKKSGKNRLVARQVAVIGTPAVPAAAPHPAAYPPAYPGAMPPQPMMPQHAMDPMNPYGTMPPGGMYGHPMPQPAYPHQPPMYYQGAPPPMPDQQYYGQPPPPYPYDPYAAAAAAQHQAMMQPGLPPPLPQQPLMPPQYGQPLPPPGAPQPQYGQPPVAGQPPQYGQPPVAGQPAPGQPGQFAQPCGQVPFPGAAPAPGPSADGQPGQPGHQASQASLASLASQAPSQAETPPRFSCTSRPTTGSRTSLASSACARAPS
eukprot:gb/GFBE01040646.1/.p1 GENE.gb/GFBE01040646.1/~~gb/GFBE01040646.1/.p1  ORF type:complete len:551 (+),score=93.45 gb/GFBE01040646.1/:1-1653(+)